MFGKGKKILMLRYRLFWRSSSGGIEIAGCYDLTSVKRKGAYIGRAHRLLLTTPEYGGTRNIVHKVVLRGNAASEHNRVVLRAHAAKGASRGKKSNV